MEYKVFNMADSKNFMDVWRSLLSAQVTHEDNQTAEWSNPLRYALAIAMSSNGWRINRKSADEMFKEAVSMLFERCSKSGLFLGFLVRTTKEPTIFQGMAYRDIYWHVTFEVPYILWVYGQSKLEQDSRKFDGPLWNRLTASGDDAGKATQQATPENSIQEGNESRDVVVTQKTMTFNDLIDQKSIVEQADEWLYPEPDFLDFVPQSHAELWMKYGEEQFAVDTQEPVAAERTLVEPLNVAYQGLLDRLQIILQNKIFER